MLSKSPMKLIVLCFLAVVFSAGATEPQVVDVDIGHTVIDLRQFDGGPNISLVIKEVDISEISVAIFDYSRMQMNVSAGDYGASASLGATQHGITVKKNDGAVLYRFGKFQVIYLGDRDSSMNHCKVSAGTIKNTAAQ